MDFPVQYIQQGAQDDEDRTVFIPLVSGTDYVTPWNNTPTGSPKAEVLPVSTGTAADSTNALAMLDTTNFPGVAKVVLTQTEAATRGKFWVGFNGGNAFGRTLVVVAEEKPENFGSSDLHLHYRAGQPS